MHQSATWINSIKRVPLHLNLNKLTGLSQSDFSNATGNGLFDHLSPPPQSHRRLRTLFQKIWKRRKALILLTIALFIWRSYAYLTRDKWVFLRVPGDGNEITSIAFTLDGKTMAFASRRVPKVHVLDLQTKKLKYNLDCSNVPMGLKFLPSGNLAVWGSALGDGDYATMWNPNGQVVEKIRSEMDFNTRLPDLGCQCKFDFELNKSGIWFDDLCDVAIFDKTTGKKVDSTRCDGLTQAVQIDSQDCRMAVLMMEFRKSNATNEKFYKTLLINLQSGTFKWLPGMSMSLRIKAWFAPDDDFMAIYDYYGKASVRVWDLVKIQQAGQLPYYSKDFEPSVRFSPDGKQLAVAGANTAYVPISNFIGEPYGEVGIWEIPTLRRIRRYKPNRILSAVEYSPDGRRMAVGFHDGTVEILKESFMR